MPNCIVELKQERAKLISDARVFLDEAETRAKEDQRSDLTADENQQHERRLKAIEELDNKIKREEKQAELERSLILEGEQHRHRPGEQKQEWRAALQRYFVTGQNPGFQESRNLQSGQGVLGGAVVMPEQFLPELIKFVDDEVFIRGLATNFQVQGADSIGAPSYDTDVSDGDWTSELVIATEDTTARFGKRNMTPHDLTKQVRVSRRLLATSAVDIVSFVQQRIAYKLAVPQEKTFLTGTGAGQPLGVFTASSNGISTARDVVSTSATEVTVDTLVKAKFALKTQYLPNANWIFSRAVLEQIFKEKDGQGQYLLQPSLQEGSPDRILGLPVRMSEFAPSTLTTGLYVGILGDFRNYWIVDSTAMDIQVLFELYAATNEVGYVGRMATDGMPVLEEAFARIKLA